MPTHQSTSSRTGKISWTEGDILYLKSWNDHEATYRVQNVPKKVPDHPAVLLFRPSADSDYLVVALMTTLNGCSLAEHGFAQSTPERLRGYVPIHPTPANAANPVKVKMQPWPTDKSPANCYINVGEIFALPGKVLQRFGDKKGHNYSLRKKSIKKLKRSLQHDEKFLRAKAVALADDVAKTYVPSNVPSSASQSNPSSHLRPANPSPHTTIETNPQPYTTIETNIPLPPIPGSFPSSPLPAPRVPLYSHVAGSTNIRADRTRYAAVPPTRAPTFANQNLPHGAHPVYPVRTTPGAYPTAGTPYQASRVATRATPNYGLASSLEQGISERQRLLGDSGYQKGSDEGRGRSWWYLVLFGGAVGALLYFSRGWWWPSVPSMRSSWERL